MAEPGDAAVAFIRDAPFAVHVALHGRLSPKWILRMRAVCRAWRDKLSHGPLLLFLHLKEPPRPLICFDRVACPDRYVQLRDYCVESLDLRSDKLRSVSRFTDNEAYDLDKYDLKGRRRAPSIDEFRVDYERMERYLQVDIKFKPRTIVHGSLDGHLLVSSVAGWYVINPATRHWVALPKDLWLVDVVGFYEDALSGTYRVLCFCPKARKSPPVYAVLTVGTKQLWNIGRPVHPGSPADHGLASGVDLAYHSPPIQFSYNYTRRLHWSPQRRQGYHMLVFDPSDVVFSWKRPPPPPLVAMGADQDMRMRLLELSTGHLGLSVSWWSRETLQLWRLEDYEHEVWVPLHQIQLVLQQMPVLQEEPFWLPGVVSEEGDVLIEAPQRVLHCDRNGNLLRQFCFPDRLFSVRHMLRESLLPLPHPADGDAEPPFFRGLCST